MTNIFNNRIVQGVAALVAIVALFVGFQTLSNNGDTATATTTTANDNATTNVTTTPGADGNTTTAPIDVVDGVGSTIEGTDTKASKSKSKSTTANTVVE